MSFRGHTKRSARTAPGEGSQPKDVFIYVAGRTCLFAVAALAALAIACPAAPAANQTVTATSGSNVFSPSSVTITQGETVTWNNDGGNFHNVHFDDESFVMPTSPLDSLWSVFRTFAQTGTFTYYCEVHKDSGMTGTVVVNPAPPADGGGGTPGPGPADTAPVSSLIGPSKQAVDKLFVRASMNEAGTLTATGAITVAGSGAAKAYGLKRVSRTVTGSQSVKLRLKLAKKALRSVKRALRHKRKVRAKVTLTAADTTGHQTIRKQTIRLTR